MRKIFASLLVLVGAPLELYFYWYRFVNEGMATWVAVVAGAGLVLLLSVFVYFLKESKKWMLPILFLAAFDVISTSAGQSFATMNAQAATSGTEAAARDAEWTIQNADASIKILDDEYTLLLQQSGTVGSIEDRAKWRTAVASLEQAKKANRDQREVETTRKRVALDSLQEASATRSVTIYSYYQSLFALDAKWIQFVLHTVLSVFLCAMTPVGVVLWTTKDNEIVVAPAIREEVASRVSSDFPIPLPVNYTRRPRKKQVKTEEETAQELEELTKVLKAIEELPDPATPRQIGKAMETSHMPVYHAVQTGKLEPISMNPLRISKEAVTKWISQKWGATSAPG